MKIKLLAFITSTFVLVSPVLAAPPSIMGGKKMTQKEVHQVGTGWPSVYYEWWHAGNPDWALGAEVVYGDWSGKFSNVEVAAAFNAPMKWKLNQRGRASFGFLFKPGVLIGSTDSGAGDDLLTFAVRSEMGVPITISLDNQNRFHLITGAVTPLSLFVVEDGDPFVIVPILGRIGFEIQAHTWIAPWVVFELGPAFAFGEFGNETKFAYRVWVGSSFW